MKTNLSMEKEIVVKGGDEVGLLSRVSCAIAEGRVNIRSICGYGVDGEGHIRIVTDNNERALALIRGAGIAAAEHDVVRCEVSPNMLHPDIGSALAGYEVESNYWCAAAHGGEHAILYFTMRDNVPATNIG
ncbi:MAG: hypothetical protein JXA24_02960 [Proteobacteria bacterium]|nr:hypothetical protein [Pseudomonadota bacterium]